MISYIDVSFGTVLACSFDRGRISNVDVPRRPTIDATDLAACSTGRPLIETGFVHVVPALRFAPDKFVVFWV